MIIHSQTFEIFYSDGTHLRRLSLEESDELFEACRNSTNTCIVQPSPKPYKAP